MSNRGSERPTYQDVTNVMPVYLYTGTPAITTKNKKNVHALVYCHVLCAIVVPLCYR